MPLFIFVFILNLIVIFIFKRQCQKFYASEHKHFCGNSMSNYENIGLPFVISLPESKLTCENVFEQIRIYAKWDLKIMNFILFQLVFLFNEFWLDDKHAFFSLTQKIHFFDNIYKMA